MARDTSGQSLWQDSAAQQAKDLSPAQKRIQAALAAHGVPAAQSRKLVNLAFSAASDDAEECLARALGQLYLFNPLIDEPHGRFMLMGSPGSGKTLALAKLASRAKALGRTVRLVTSEAARSHGIEPLKHFAETLGLEIEIAGDSNTLAALGATSGATLLIDSAGINPYSPADRQALEGLAQAAKAEPILVLAAGGDPADTVETAHVFRDIGCQRVLVTRLDIVRRIGSVMAVPEALGIAFAEGLAAASPAQGIEPFSAVNLAQRLLQAG